MSTPRKSLEASRRMTSPEATTAPSQEIRSWRPLLSGSLAEAARAAVMEIAGALREPSGAAWEDPGLLRGASGHAMLYSYLADCGLDEGAAETAELFEQRARFLITRAPASLALHYGLAGVGAAAICSPRSASRPYAEKLCRTIDLVLARTLQQSRWDGPFDLLGGLVGLGVYTSFRLEEPIAAEILGRIVELLEGLAEATPEGLAWRTRPEHVYVRAREKLPNGYFDLGLAHGAAGVIAFLCQCAHLGVDPVRARRLATQALPWLRSQQLPDPAPPRYVGWVAPGVEPQELARIAWCKGDTSVAIGMLAAGRLLGLPEWEREAIDLARNAASCPPSRDGIKDTCMCHGAAGVGHIFNRMALQTGDRVLEDAARNMFERTLRMLPSGDVMAAFAPRDSTAAGGHGMLMGAAGVALALTAAISSVPPDWDRVFLLSWPEPTGTQATAH